jgi:phage gp36-like protein
MAYCSNSAIRLNLPILPNTATASGFFKAKDIIDFHIRRTDGLIDGKCARRYDLPFSPVPPVIRTIAEDITSYYVYRSFVTQDNQNRSEYLEELKDGALKVLDEIMSGAIDLVDTSGSAVLERTSEVTDALWSNTQEYQPFFDIDSVTSQDFDDDLKDAVSDDRA